MERVLPKTLDYTDVLPLAVESRARRRTFFPVNGQKFVSNGANIIRIDLSADALLDTQHSYLRFDFTTKTRACGIDSAGGHAFIRRLRIEQSGVVLEDINAYNRLMGAIVLPCQSGEDHNKERSITEFVQSGNSGIAISNTRTQAASRRAAAASADGGSLITGQIHNIDTQLPVDQKFTFSIPLNSGLLNSDKLVPLMLMSAPLTIEIELAPSTEPVVYETDNTGTYEIENVRYIANLVEVGGDVAQQLRMVQEMSGGVLTLAGQTYRHFTGAVAGATAGDQVVNVPARVKSMKSLFFASQGAAGNLSDFQRYGVSFGGNFCLNEFQLKIGSVVYPPTPVRCSFGDGTNGFNGAGNSKSEPLMELAKAWGNVGSTKGLGQLDFINYASQESVAPVGSGTSTGLKAYAPFGIDLEAFQRVAIESGVNTADRSLPISLILNTTANVSATTIDAFVLADALFYINADGSMSVSV